MINSDNQFQNKLVWVVIFVAHIVLLKWIFYALYQSGVLSSTEIFLHFTGMSIYGAGLIWTCAWLARRKYVKDGNEIIK